MSHAVMHLGNVTHISHIYSHTHTQKKLVLFFCPWHNQTKLSKKSYNQPGSPCFKEKQQKRSPVTFPHTQPHVTHSSNISSRPHVIQAVFTHSTLSLLSVQSSPRHRLHFLPMLCVRVCVCGSVCRLCVYEALFPSGSPTELPERFKAWSGVTGKES